MTILIRWKRLMALLMKSHWGWTVRCHVILGKPNQNLVINEYTDKSLQKRPLEMIWNCVKILWILQNWSYPWIRREDWVTKLKLLRSNFFSIIIFWTGFWILDVSSKCCIFIVLPFLFNICSLDKLTQVAPTELSLITCHSLTSLVKSALMFRFHCLLAPE